MAKRKKGKGTPLHNLGLSQGTINLLVRGGVRSVQVLDRIPATKVRAIIGLSKAQYRELEEACDRRIAIAHIPSLPADWKPDLSDFEEGDRLVVVQKIAICPLFENLLKVLENLAQLVGWEVSAMSSEPLPNFE